MEPGHRAPEAMSAPRRRRTRVAGHLAVPARRVLPGPGRGRVLPAPRPAGRATPSSTSSSTRAPCWRRALHLWDPSGGFGQVQNQAYGYLFPMGPFFWLGRPALGARAGSCSGSGGRCCSSVAFLGVVKLCGALGLGSPTSRIVAGFAYALSPRILTHARPDLDRGLAERPRAVGAGAARHRRQSGLAHGAPRRSRRWRSRRSAGSTPPPRSPWSRSASCGC